MAKNANKFDFVHWRKFNIIIKFRVASLHRTLFQYIYVSKCYSCEDAHSEADVNNKGTCLQSDTNTLKLIDVYYKLKSIRQRWLAVFLPIDTRFNEVNLAVLAFRINIERDREGDRNENVIDNFGYRPIVWSNRLKNKCKQNINEWSITIYWHSDLWVVLIFGHCANNKSDRFHSYHSPRLLKSITC